MVVVDLAVTGGRVFLSGQLQEVTLGITDGTITHILSPSTTISSDRVVDVAGKIVLPGFVDSHVHLRPSESDHGPDGVPREGVDTGTAAAAAGGVTTVIDMPNFAPTVVDKTQWDAKVDLFEGNAHVDYSFYGTVSMKNLGSGAIADVAEAGVPAFKTFLTASGGPGDLVISDKGDLYSAFEEVGETDRPFYIHAEDNELHSRFERLARESDAEGIEEFLQSRPPILERTAVNDIIEIARDTGVTTVIAHTTTAEALNRIADARSDGVPIYAETTPYYLGVDTDELRKRGVKALGTPAVRDPENRKLLWELLNEGRVETLGTDHAPRTASEHDRPPIDAGKGMPQLETSVGFLLSAVAEGRVSLKRIVELYSRRPAEIHGLYPRKGNLNVGADADFVVVDMDAEWTVTPSEFESRAKYSAFDGRTFTAQPVQTFVRGHEVANDMTSTEITPGNLVTRSDGSL